MSAAIFSTAFFHVTNSIQAAAGETFAAATPNPATTPDPVPSLRPGLDPSSVSPGALGFWATGLVVVLSIGLIFDMVRRLRKIRYRVQAEEKVRAEIAAARLSAQAGVAEEPAISTPEDKARGSHERAGHES